MMRKLVAVIISLLINIGIFAQCSICTKTAQQLGDGPAHGLNSGIMYLAFAPLLIMGYIGFKWWKNEKNKNA